MKTSRLALIAFVAASIFACNMAMAQNTNLEPASVTTVVPSPVPNNNNNSGGLPSHFLTDLVAAAAFGLLSIVLIILGYKVVDWALRGVCFDTELAKGNMAVGVVVAAIIIGISISVSNVVVAILH